MIRRLILQIIKHWRTIVGRRKLAGEKEIEKILDEYFIVRTAWLYGLNGHNFVYTMLRLFNKKNCQSSR